MPAYVITYLEITDRERFDEYRRLAGPTFAPYGGKPVVVDGRFEVLEGMINPKSIVVIQFESFEDAKRWYAAEYAATIPLRNQSANSSLILVDGHQPSATLRT
jgi:uncharacterized protein (DUF1330 family)